MTSKEIKKNFARYFVGRYVVANEINELYNPDILLVDRDGWVKEYEIKVTISDFRRELTYIDQAIALPDEEQGSNNKIIKHKLYLRGPVVEWFKDDPRDSCPATFTFLIPRKLYELEKARLDKFPYGVMDCETFEVIKPARHLKWAKPLSTRQFWAIAHSLNYKIINLENEAQELLEQEEQLAKEDNEKTN